MSNFADLAEVDLDGGSGTFLVRWRGRQEGPYPASVIEAKLAANELGMLHEILHNGQWVTIKNFIAEKQAALQAQRQAQVEQEREPHGEAEQNIHESEPHFVTCSCRHCKGHIEFDASDFSEGETRTLPCPFCSRETVIFVPVISIRDAPANIESPPFLPIWFGSASSLLEVRLTSGALFQIDEVKLVDAKALNRVATLKAGAAQTMGGESTGLWAFGSLSWVLMASCAISAVDSALSSSAAKQGASWLQEAMQLEKEIRQRAQFFPVGQIANMEHPAPFLWHVPEQPSCPAGAIHSGDDFVTVKDTVGLAHSIRWGAVESYKYHPNKTEAATR